MASITTSLMAKPLCGGSDQRLRGHLAMTMMTSMTELAPAARKPSTTSAPDELLVCRCVLASLIPPYLQDDSAGLVELFIVVAVYSICVECDRPGRGTRCNTPFFDDSTPNSGICSIICTIYLWCFGDALLQSYSGSDECRFS